MNFEALSLCEGACYLQVTCWRGVSLTIVAFARSLLTGHVSGQAARTKWREMTSPGAENIDVFASFSFCQRVLHRAGFCK